MLLAIILVLPACQGFAQVQSRDQLVRAFERARSYDPQFQSALAELDANRIGARIARVSYYPSLQVSVSQLDFENAQRRTVTLSQPLISLDKYASYKEAEPREQLAQATVLVREQDLAVRLFKAVAELIRSEESLSTNTSRIKALEQQATAAKRAYDLGQGTITDMRDTQVRVDQARATDLAIKARKSAAERQFAAIVGEPLQARAFNLAREKRDIKLDGASDYLPVAKQINPLVIIARANARIGELGVLHAKSAVLPTISANVVHTQVAGAPSSSFAGIFLSYPLQAGGILNLSGAQANSRKLMELVRDAELQVALDAERLLTYVGAGRAETEIRLDAIRSAQLSVIANEKSFSGGVRTNIDVLNAIQALYQTQEDYVNAVLTLAENLLNLRLKVAIPPRDCLGEVARLLF